MSLLKAVTSRFTKSGNNCEGDLRQSGLRSLAMALVEPIHGERVRAGLRFAGGCQVIASGIAPVQVIPTTTATLLLHNGEAAGGRSLLIDRLGYTLGSGTPAAGAAIWACVSNAAITQPAMASNYAVGSLSAGGKASKARWALAQTIAGTWFQLDGNAQLAAANVGQGAPMTQIDGGILVPPGYGLGIAILSGAGTTPLYSVSAWWDELELDLE